MKKICILLCLFCLIRAYSQDNGEGRLGAWYMYFGMNKISERWSIHTEAQFRFWESFGNFNQLLLRTGGNYHINENAIATLGYAYISTDISFEESPDEENISEHRIFEQFILKNEVWKFLFEHRYRFEQRFIDFGTFSDTRHRARYRLQLTLPLSETIFLNFYDEIFLNLQDEIFDQNRLYGAFGLKISPATSVQLGYLKLHFRNTNYDRLQLGFFINPDFSSKSKSTP